MHREDLVFTDASKDQQTIRKYNYKKKKREMRLKKINNIYINTHRKMEMRSQPVARVARKGSMPRSLFDSGELGLTCHGVRI